MKRQLKELSEQHLRDSTKLLEYQQLLRSQADSIATLRQEIAELKYSKQSTPLSQETAILEAINKGNSMSSIEKMPGYDNFIKKYSKQYSSFKYAVSWVVDHDLLLEKGNDGSFMGDKTKRHDPQIAREIKTLIWASKEKGWTAQSIIDCHKVIVILLNKAEKNDRNAVKNKNKELPSRKETVTQEEERQILVAINSGYSMSKIVSLPGYNSFIQKNSAKYSPFKYAVSWIVNYDSLLGKDSDTGGFKADKKKKHNPKIASGIRALIQEQAQKGWTVQSIIDCHKGILELMNQAEPITK